MIEYPGRCTPYDDVFEMIFQLTDIGHGLRIREAPSLGGTILRTMNKGTEVVVECGPVCANGIVWWGVKRGKRRGWSAEVRVPKDGEAEYYLEESPEE